MVKSSYGKVMAAITEMRATFMDNHKHLDEVQLGKVLRVVEGLDHFIYQKSPEFKRLEASR